MSGRGGFLSGYLRFLGGVAALVGALIAVGYFATRGQDPARFEAVVAACLATGIASAISGLPIAATGGGPQAALNRFLLAMLARLALVAGLAAYCVLGLEVERGPFLLWLVVSYLVLLALDTWFALRAAKSL